MCSNIEMAEPPTRPRDSCKMPVSKLVLRQVGSLAKTIHQQPSSLSRRTQLRLMPWSEKTSQGCHTSMCGSYSDNWLITWELPSRCPAAPGAGSQHASCLGGLGTEVAVGRCNMVQPPTKPVLLGSPHDGSELLVPTRVTR